jgi:hypothetical protein
MRRSAVLLTLAVLVLAGGCERKDASDEPRAYDPSLDAPPSPIVANPDPLLLANQTEIAKNSPKRSTGAPGGHAQPMAAVNPAPKVEAEAAPTPKPAEAGRTPSAAANRPEAKAEDVEAIKKVFIAYIDAYEAKQYTQFVGFFVSDDAGAIRPLVSTTTAFENSAHGLIQLIRQKFGPQLPEDMAQFVTNTETSLEQGSKINRANPKEEVNKLLFTSTKDGKVVVSDDAATEVTFVNVTGAWKIELDPKMRPLLKMTIDAIKAMDKLCDSLASGIENNTITKDNFSAQFQERAQTFLVPIQEKLATVAALQEKAKTSFLCDLGIGVPADLGEGQPVAAGQKDPAYLEAVAALWTAGQRDQAAEALLQINWQKPAVFAPDSVFTFTDAQLKASPSGPQEQVVAKAKALRELCIYMADLSQKAAQAGDAAKAKRYMDSVVACGQFLQTSTKLRAFQVIGMAITNTSGPIAAATGGTGTVTTVTPVPPVTPTAPAAPPPSAGPAPASGGEDINSGRGPEKAEEMKRRLIAPATRVYGGGS